MTRVIKSETPQKRVLPLRNNPHTEPKGGQTYWEVDCAVSSSSLGVAGTGLPQESDAGVGNPDGVWKTLLGTWG
jgi:hypothetical protein